MRKEKSEVAASAEGAAAEQQEVQEISEETRSAGKHPGSSAPRAEFKMSNKGGKKCKENKSASAAARHPAVTLTR